MSSTRVQYAPLVAKRCIRACSFKLFCNFDTQIPESEEPLTLKINNGRKIVAVTAILY